MSNIQNIIDDFQQKNEISEIQTKLDNFKEDRVNFFNQRNIFDKQEQVLNIIFDIFLSSKQDEYFQNKEECLDYINKREEYLLMMARTRFLIHKINYSMNFYSKSYYVLTYAINNLYLYSLEYRNVENGEEQENQDIDNLKP